MQNSGQTHSGSAERQYICVMSISNGRSSSCKRSETAEHVPVIRNLQLRNMCVLEQLNIVKRVCVAPPEDAIAPGGDAGLAR